MATGPECSAEKDLRFRPGEETVKRHGSAIGRQTREAKLYDDHAGKPGQGNLEATGKNDSTTRAIAKPKHKAAGQRP